MENYEKIVVLENEIQAQLLDSILEDQKIPHIMRSYHDSAMDGLFQGQYGWGHVEAPLKYKDQILTIINDLEKKPSDDNTTN